MFLFFSESEFVASRQAYAIVAAKIHPAWLNQINTGAIIKR